MPSAQRVSALHFSPPMCSSSHVLTCFLRFVERASGMSLGEVVPAKKMANAKELEEAHDALARVEYELRVAREDVAETKAKLALAEKQLQAPLAAVLKDMLEEHVYFRKEIIAFMLCGGKVT